MQFNENRVYPVNPRKGVREYFFFAAFDIELKQVDSIDLAVAH